MKRIALVIVGLVGLAGLGFALLVPRATDGGRQGQEVAQRLAEATGQRVQISGPVTVRLWPRAEISIKGLSLVEASGREALLSVPEMRLAVSRRALLTGAVQVESVQLFQPAFLLRRQAGGGFSWNPAGVALGVDDLTLSDGSLLLVQNGQKEKFSNLSGSLQVSRAAGWQRLELTASWHDAPVALKLNAGAADGMGLSLVQAELDVAGAGAHAEFAGRVGNGAVSWPVDGRLKLAVDEPQVLWSLLAPLTGVPLAADEPALRTPLKLGATISGNQTSYEVRDLAFSLGTLAGQGLGRVVPGPVPGISVALQLDTLNLADWPAASGAIRAGHFRLPVELLAAFDVRLNRVDGWRVPLSNVLLKGELKGGTLTLKTGGAQLPGATKATLTGSITTAAAAVPQADLQLVMDTAQLGDLLEAGGLAHRAAVPSQLKLAVNLRGAWNRPGLPEVRLTVDGTELRAQASRRDNGLWDLRLTAEQMDLGRYMAGGAAPLWLWDLPPYNAALTVRQLRAGTQVAENVSLDAAYDGKVLTVKQINLRAQDGTTLGLSGTLGRDTSVPFDFTAKLMTVDFAALRGAVPAAAALLPDMLGQVLSGPVNIETRWRVAGPEAARLAVASFAEGKIDTVVMAVGDAPLSWKVRLRHADAAALAKKLALGSALPLSGPVDLYAEGENFPDGRWTLKNLQGQLAGAQIADGAFSVKSGVVPEWNGQLKLGSAQLQPLLSLAGWPQLTVGAGRLELTADSLMAGAERVSNLSGVLRLAGGAIAFERLAGSWRHGTLSLSGQANLSDPAGIALAADVDVHGAEVNWRSGSRLGVAGPLDLSFRAKTVGGGRDSWLKSLSGDGSFSFAGGKFSGVDFAALAQALSTQKDKANLETLLARGGTTDLQSLGGDFVVADGLLSAPTVRLRTPAAEAEGSLQVDLAAPRLDAISKVRLTGLENLPALGMTVAGPLDALAAGFDTAELAAALQPPPAETPVTSPAAEAQKNVPLAELPDVSLPKPPEAEKPASVAAEAEGPFITPVPVTKKTNFNRKPAPPTKTSFMPSMSDILSALTGRNKKAAEAPPPSAGGADLEVEAQGLRVIKPAAGADAAEAPPQLSELAGAPRTAAPRSMLKLPTATGQEEAGGAPPTLDELMKRVE